MDTHRHDALLLLGPTGSGKTPLGAYIQRHGYAGRPAHHFDFGAELRAAAAGARGIPEAERAYVERVLSEGALLEDDTFYIAQHILEAFLAQRAVGAEDWIVLNGLPRHVGQARDLAGVLEVRGLIVLSCKAEVVRERIRRNTGGDRTVRTDDSEDAIGRKLEIFAERTTPLIAHYRDEGAAIMGVPIGVKTQPLTIVNILKVYA